MTKQFIFDKIVCDETNNTKEEVAPGVFWLGGTLYDFRFGEKNESLSCS